MLDTLDVLIGFTVVMLVVSMAVTMLTQMIASGMVNLRGWCLKQGVSRLLALMDQGLTLPDARKITDHVLRNPLVGRARLPLPGVRAGYSLATVIHREELIRLLLDFAIPGDAEKTNLNELPDEAELRNRFRASLKRNGIDDPEAVLQQVRTAIVELEKTNPELSHNARVAIALLNFASSNFLGKFNTWFDQTMDRVSELFTRQARAVTALVAIVLAFALQLDSVGLINRLSVDEKLRDSLVEKAIANQEVWRQKVEAQQRAQTPGAAGGAAGAEAADEGNVATPTPAADDSAANVTAADPAANAAAADDAAGNAVAAGEGTEGNVASGDGADATPGEEPMVAVRRTIEEVGVVALPRSWKQWRDAWKDSAERGGGFRWPMLLGILLSAALLSLGAPFWYSVLANLLKLRSVIARKDEVQREERQTTQAAATTSAATPGAAGGGGLPPNLAGGEAGNLEATG